MRWDRRVALLAGGATFAAAPAMAALYVAARDGFGAGDVVPFAFWGVFLSVIAGLVAPAVLHAGRRRQRPVAAAMAGLAGLGLGVVYTMVMALVLGPVVHAFSFPILYIWSTAAAAGLVLACLALPVPAAMAAERRPFRWRRVLAGVAIVALAVVALPILLLLGSMFVWGRAEPEIHLVAEGYEGPVVIVFGDSTAAALPREGRSRVHHIPPGGVLRTSTPSNPGWGRPRYFQVNAEGRRTPLIGGGTCTDSLPGDPPQLCSMPRMYVVGREGPDYEYYVVSRRAGRRALEARGDSMVQFTVFGDSAFRVR